MILATHGIVGSSGSFIVPPLLDIYPSAAAAYSLRKLRSAYTGSAIRVRRSSDNAEQDIGFVNNVLDTSSLLSFVGSNNGFVKTWYDQSGNSRDVTQTTASSQPIIVSSGSVLLVNNKPAIHFNNAASGNQIFLRNTTSPSLNQPATDFCAFKVNQFLSGVSYQTYYDGGSTESLRGYFGHQASNNNDIQYNFVILNGYTSTLNQTLATIVRNSSSSQIYKNNSLQATGNAGNYSLTGLTFGADYTSSAQANVFHQEFIRYNGVSSNISAINQNINSYYGIY